MIRMQVQLPDELYRQLRAVADEKEWSLAETLRRAGELLISVNPKVGSRSEEKWELPQADLGVPLAPEEKWAEILEQDMLARHAD